MQVGKQTPLMAQMFFTYDDFLSVQVNATKCILRLRNMAGIAPTHTQVITGSHDSTIRLWDLRNAKTSSQLTFHKKRCAGCLIRT
jgi:WD40 repeat protein